MTAKGKYTKKKHIQDISVSPMSHANQCLQYLKQISWLVSFFNSLFYSAAIGNGLLMLHTLL